MRAKLWRSVFLSLALVVTAGWLGWLMWGLIGKAQIAIEQASHTKADYAELEGRKAALQKDLDRLATPRGQDAAIREAFSVAKSGEEVIVVVPQPAATTTPQKTWWEKIFGWF